MISLSSTSLIVSAPMLQKRFARLPMSNPVETVRSAFERVQDRLDALRDVLDSYTPPALETRAATWLRATATPLPVLPKPCERFAHRLEKWKYEARGQRLRVEPSDAQIADVLKLRASGLSYAAIARQLPISSDRVGKICRAHGVKIQCD